MYVCVYMGMYVCMLYVCIYMCVYVAHYNCNITHEQEIKVKTEKITLKTFLSQKALQAKLQRVI